VPGFKRCGNFELSDVASLRVDAGEDVADGTVLAGSVHALKDDEKGFLLRGVEDFLQISELFPVLCEDGVGVVVAFESAVFVGGAARELNLRVRFDQVGRL